LEIRTWGCQNNKVGTALPGSRETDMILEDLEHRGEELKKRIESVRSYL